MSFWDTLFGGGKSTTTPKDLTPPEFTALRGPLAQQLGAVASQGGLPGYGGPLYAEIDPQAQAAINAAAQAGQGTPGYLQAAQEETQRTLSGAPGSGNPYLQQMIDAATRPLRSAFEESVVPQLLSRFTGAGQQTQGEGSSAFAREANRASRDYLQQVADVGTQLSFGAFESEAARRQQAVAQAANLSSESMNRLNTSLQASLLPQLIKDQGVQRGIEAFNKQQETLLAVLAMIANLAQPTPVTAGKSTQSGGIGSLFGGGGINVGVG